MPLSLCQRHMSSTSKYDLPFLILENEFDELKQAIEAAKLQPPAECKRPANSPCKLPQDQVERHLNRANDAYMEFDMVTALLDYHSLDEAGVDWIPYFRGRLGLTWLVQTEITEVLEKSIQYASESIRKCPLESSGYVALALIRISQFRTAAARVWLELAELTGTVVPCIIDFAKSKYEIFLLRGTMTDNTV